MHYVTSHSLKRLLALALLIIATFGVLSQASAPSSAAATSQSVSEQTPTAPVTVIMAGKGGRGPWGGGG